MRNPVAVSRSTRLCASEASRMSVAATADAVARAKEGGAAPLLLSPRALRRPVAASLLLHVSVCASLIFWWQSGAPAPRGVEEGLSVTFVELSPPAPAAP